MKCKIDSKNSIDLQQLFNKVQQMEKNNLQLEKSYLQMEKSHAALVKRNAELEKTVFELIKIREDQCKKIEEQNKIIDGLKKNIDDVESYSKSVFNVAYRSFRYCKALAFSTGRTRSDSITEDQRLEQVKSLEEFELKNPEEYPVKTYEVRTGRIKEMANLIKKKGEITTSEIVRRFRVCHQTAREDMKKLLSVFPDALSLFVPKTRGRESYKLVEKDKLAWCFPVSTL